MANGKSVREVPDAWVDYQFCKHFGWTPAQLDKIDIATLEIFADIINCESERQIKDSKSYG